MKAVDSEHLIDFGSLLFEVAWVVSIADGVHCGLDESRDMISAPVEMLLLQQSMVEAYAFRPQDLTRWLVQRKQTGADSDNSYAQRRLESFVANNGIRH